MTIETRGPRASDIGSDFSIAGPRSRSWRARRKKGFQIFAIRARRHRLVMDDPREASARIFGPSFFHQDASGLLQHLRAVAAEAVDEALGSRAVALAHQLDEQIVLRFAPEHGRIERARGLAQESVGDAMEVAVLARLQQKVPVFDARQPLMKSATSLEHVAPHHELARHDVPRTLEQLLHRRRRRALRLAVEASDLTPLQIDLESTRV